MRFTVDRLDHLVLTCADLEITAAWYQRVLGMEREEFGEDRRTALKFGGQKLNLHQFGAEFRPNAAAAAPGTADLCFVTAVRTPDIVGHLHGLGVAIELGPVARTGALGPMWSVYCRDPDGTLIEIATYLSN
jgi:catechol 2,3-dioxygenase-like lactoylglutathione lyase family enzyme